MGLPLALIDEKGYDSTQCFTTTPQFRNVGSRAISHQISGYRTEWGDIGDIDLALGWVSVPKFSPDAIVI